MATFADVMVKLWYYSIMKFIVKSPKYGAVEVIVDDEDKRVVESNKWYLHKAGQFLYIRSGNRKYLHRLIMGEPNGLVVDHINRDTLDNRRSNLRAVTIQWNLRNQKRPNNKTGVTGVAIAHNGKYSAQIKHNYKKIHLGVFNTIKEAATARKKAEERLWAIK